METWQVVLGVLGPAAGIFTGAGILKWFVFDRPKVRLTATAVGVEKVLFSVTNVRSAEVHITTLHGVAKDKDGKKHEFAFLTDPLKAPTFRLPGLERVMFTAKVYEVFPEDYFVGGAVREIYVEDIATQRRWKLPKKQLDELFASVKERLSYRYVPVEWTMSCTKCDATEKWESRTPKYTGHGFQFGTPALEGWTKKQFEPPITDATGLCPECSVVNAESA